MLLIMINLTMGDLCKKKNKQKTMSTFCFLEKGLNAFLVPLF